MGELVEIVEFVLETDLLTLHKLVEEDLLSLKSEMFALEEILFVFFEAEEKIVLLLQVFLGDTVFNLNLILENSLVLYSILVIQLLLQPLLASSEPQIGSVAAGGPLRAVPDQVPPLIVLEGVDQQNPLLNITFPLISFYLPVELVDLLLELEVSRALHLRALKILFVGPLILVEVRTLVLQ